MMKELENQGEQQVCDSFSPAGFIGPRPGCHLTFKLATHVGISYRTQKQKKSLWYFRYTEFH